MHKWRRGRESEGEKESQAGSILSLEHMNCEIMTWPKIKTPDTQLTEPPRRPTLNLKKKVFFNVFEIETEHERGRGRE